MKRRSQLRHTSMDNGLAFLFEPLHEEGTLAVLREVADEHEYKESREAIARWRQTTRHAVAENLNALEREYTPFAEGLEVLRARMPASEWEHLSAVHGIGICARLGIDVFVKSVRDAMRRFDEGLDAVAEGKMTLGDLKALHTEMVVAYRGP